MNKYYVVKVRLQFEDDNGKMKKQTEIYLVEAVSCTDAEAIVTKDFEGYTWDWEVKGVNESAIVKVMTADDN